MNSQQVQDIRLMYEAVYNEELREHAEEYNNIICDEDIVEIATEYFYTYGLNEDGIDILIEKVGLDNFVEFVYDLSEDILFLGEAKKSKAKKQPSMLASQRAKLAAQKRNEEEKKPESRGADTEAKAEQPKSKKPIRDAIARQVLAGMERHRKGMELAKKTGETLGRLASATHEAGRRAGEHVKKHGLKSLANEEVDLFDYLIEYLVAEGYADTNQDALVIMANLNQDQIDDILTERRRVDKGTPRGPEPSAAFKAVSASMGSSRSGVQPRGKKKDRGGPTPGPDQTPARRVELRRAAAQSSREMQSSRFD